MIVRTLAIVAAVAITVRIARPILAAVAITVTGERHGRGGKGERGEDVAEKTHVDPLI